MAEMFTLVKPKLSQLDVLSIVFYCYIMKYKFIYDESKILINSRDGKYVAYIQNGIRKEKDEKTGEEIKVPILNVIFGNEKRCLSDLFVTLKMLADFIFDMEKLGIPEEVYVEKNLYIFYHEVCSIDFIKRNEDKHKEPLPEGSVIIETKDYKTQKNILYDLITAEYPKAEIIFRNTDEGMLIVSKKISSYELEQIVSKLFNTKVINDKGLYENLRYGKRYPKRDRKTT